MKLHLLSALIMILVIGNSVFGKEGIASNAQSFANKKAPLSFMENKGQITDQNYQPRPDIQFQLKAANGLTIFVGDGAIHYQFAKADKMPEPKKTEDRFDPKKMMEHDSTTYTLYRMDVELMGANKHAKVITENKQDYYENYYTTGTGENGATVYAYSKITYKDIYPNIDWVLYTRNNELKHEFIVKQGGNPDDIKLKYGGATNLQLHKDGSLEATTPQGTITEQAPVSYTQEGQQVTSSFSLKENVLSYEVGNYEGTLVIDPSLVWATYYGGSGNDFGYGISNDTSGNVFISGNTVSTNNIATVGAYQNFYGGGNTDIFIAKYNNNGTIQWATYYGGSYDDNSRSICTDLIGNIFITGITLSSGLATAGAYQTSYLGGYDAIVIKFNNYGLRIWATYYGGSGYDLGMCVVTDLAGNIFVSGYTTSTSGISTSGAFQTNYGGSNDAFIAKFNNSGTRLWATYYGWSGPEYGCKMCVDYIGNLYITGETSSNSGVATTGAFQTNNGGFTDAYVAKFNTSGVRQWGTYFGGAGYEYDQGFDISTDASGNVFIAGTTTSTNGISTIGAFQTSYGGGSFDDFIAKFSGLGQRLWATYYGGVGNENFGEICNDFAGDVFIAGTTTSTNGISTIGAIQTNIGGSRDAYIAKFNNSGSMQWGTYFGGFNEDIGNSLVANQYGNVYLTGYTTSLINISTSNSNQSIFGGGTYDAFIAKFDYNTIANAGNDTSICKGNTAQIGSSTQSNHYYSWSSNPSGFSSNSSYPFVSPLTTTSYFLKDSVDASSSGYDTVVVTVNQLPIVNAGVDQNICLGNSTTLNATGAVNYSWSGGLTNNQSFISSTTSNYVVTGIDANGCSNKDTVQVTVNPYPNANATFTNTAICPNGNSSLSASGGTSYLWSNGDTATTTTVNQAGNYYVVATNEFGCNDTSNTIAISQKTLPTTVKIKFNGASSVCAPGTVAYVLDMPLGSTTGFAYQWYVQGSAIPGATDSFYNANTTGSYALAVSGGSNCLKYSYPKTATIKAAPTASFAATSATNICTGGFVVLVAPSITGYTYTWLNDGVVAGTGPNKIFKVSGNYTVIAKINGCSDTASPALPIIVNPLPVSSISALNATTFCAGDSCTLAAQPAGAISYEWHNGNYILDTTTTPIFNIGSTATIKVLVKDANGCIGKLSSNNVKTKVNSIPLASISTNGSTTISSTGSVKLKAMPTVGVFWQWYKDGNPINNATGNQYTATSGGSYTVVITKLGCKGISIPVVVTQTTPKDEVSTTTITEGSFELSAYPNPVSDMLTVYVSGLEEVNGTIQVMDCLGNKIAEKEMKEATVSIDMKGFASGVYLVRVKSDNGGMGLIKVSKN